MNTTRLIILIVAGLTSFILSALLGKWCIPLLSRLHFGQTIREEGPNWHKKKQGTPTMGGILFILSTAIVTVLTVLVCQLFLDQKPLTSFTASTEMLVGAFLLPICCGLIGFADDYIKVVKKRNLGLTAKQKLAAQLLVAVAFALLLYFSDAQIINIPFVGKVDFGIWFIPFCVFVVLAMSNATNLTDGVDGLCGSVSLIAALALLIMASAAYALGISILITAFAGALAGFLLWNLHPAKVFMGDTGSLYIGALLTGAAFALGVPFLLIPIGIIYILENLSVILQVAYFKITKGKRLFKMAPLHHHFEMCGWKENTIVCVFSAVTLVGCVLALILFYTV